MKIGGFSFTLDVFFYKEKLSCKRVIFFTELPFLYGTEKKLSVVILVDLSP